MCRILLVHATSKNFIKYSENARTANTKVDKSLALKHKALLNDLHNMQANLSFSKLLVQEACKKLFQAKHDELRIAASIEAEWVDATCKRLRNLCRVVQQACLKEASRTREFEWMSTALALRRQMLWKCMKSRSIYGRHT